MRSELGSDEHAVSELPASGDYHSEAGWSGITPTASRTGHHAYKGTPVSSGTGSPWGGFAELGSASGEDGRGLEGAGGSVSPLEAGSRRNT